MRIYLATFYVFSIALFFTNCSSTPAKDAVNQTYDQHRENDNGMSVPPGSLSTQQRVEEAEGKGSDVRRMAPGHLFKLRQLEDDNLNGTFRVNFEGWLNLPYGVNIHAAGLTMPELKSQVAAKYRSFFKASSDIGIELLRPSYWIEIRGLISKPGRYLIKKNTSLEEVIAMAGGFGKGEEANYVKIAQAQSTHTLNLGSYFETGEKSEIPNWKGGDILFFQKDLGPDEEVTEKLLAPKSVKLLGEVHKPGSIVFKKESDFYYYLAKAGGPTSSADLKKIVLIRGKDFQRNKIEFSAEDAGSLPLLEDGDTLIVASDKPSGFSKFIQTTTGIVTMVTSVAFLIVVL